MPNPIIPLAGPYEPQVPLAQLLWARIEEYAHILNHPDPQVRCGALVALRAELRNLIHHLNQQAPEAEYFQAALRGVHA